jgi:hypothetical protein
MTIEINTDLLKQLSITADEFCFLILTYRKESIEDLKLIVDQHKLEEAGYIKLGEDEVFLREHFLQYVESSFDKMWHGLLSTYPLKVLANGQLRILRAKDPTSKANAKAKVKYQKIVGNDVTKHQHIIECLNRELQLRKTSNSLGYMQQLETWINNYSWEKYSDLSEDGTTTKLKSEGRITRQL